MKTTIMPRSGFAGIYCVIGLAISVVLCHSTMADAPAFADFARCIIATPSAAIRPAGDGSVRNVPVLLRLSENIDGFRYADFQRADYADLAIYNETLTSLPYEVQVWDETGESLLWVKVSTLTANTVLTVAYGCADAADNTPADTWSAYAGAWHFDELGEGGTAIDASGNGRDGDCPSATTGKEDGVLGAYRENVASDGSGQGGILFSGTASLDLGQHFTLSTWLRRNTISSGWDHLFYKKNNSGDWNGFASELYGQDGAYGRIGILGRGENNTGRALVNHGIAAADTWYHIIVVYDGTTARLYNNGVLMGSGSLGSDPATWSHSASVCLGADSDRGSGSWNGAFDEFRLIGESFDDGRAALEYNLQADADAFSYRALANTGTFPVLAEPVVTYEAGVFSVTASLTSGTATSVKAVFDGGIEIELAPNGAAAPWSVTVPVSSYLTADTTYTLQVRAANADGFNASIVLPGTFYTGTVSVEKTADAAEENLVPGSFTVRRADTAHDLAVAYAVSGTAVPGADYTALSGSVVIPAGSASASIAVQPLPSAATDADVTVVAAVAEGLYTPSATSAALTIVNSRNGDFTRYSHQLPMSVNPERYSRDDILSGLPVLVRLSESIDGFHYADFQQADYSDLAFALPDGTILPYEVDTWDPSGTSLVWVKVPAFSKDTVILALYGAAGSAENAPASVWSDYIGVWHFGEQGDGVVTVHDATAHALDGTTTANSLAIADGAVGAARAPAHQSGNSEIGHIIVPCSGTDSPLNADYPYLTVSFWLRLNGNESWAYLIDRKAKDDWDTWGLQFGNSTSTDILRFWRDGSSKRDLSMGSALSRQVWHHITAVWDGRYRDLYVDGVHVQNHIDDWNWMQHQTGRHLAIGGAVNNDAYGSLNGDMDEVRLRAGVVSEAWESAQYAMGAYADFLLPGAVAIVDNSAPAVGYARAVNLNGAATIEIPLTAGSGNVFALLRDASGTVTTNLVAGNLAAPEIARIAVADLPVRYAWYDVGAYAENGDLHDARDFSARVFNGAVSVVSCLDGCLNGPVPGTFKIVCDAGAGAVLTEPLEVAYTLSGDLVAGTDFAALPGSVTIPAGETAVYLDIVPLEGGSAGSVTFTLASAFCPVDAKASSATLAIAAAEAAVPEKRTRFIVSGYSGEAVEGFPALVRLHDGDGSFFYDNVRYRDTGADLYFTLDDGTPVPHDIDEWNFGGESLVWVRLPVLRAGAAVILHIGGAAREAAPSDVWTGMTGVWHLLSSSGNFLNAAAPDGNALRAWNQNSTASADGIVGRARSISSSTTQDNKGGHALVVSANDALAIGDTLTISGWLRYHQGQTPGWDRIFGHKSAYNSTSGWEISLYQNDATKIDIRGGVQTSYGATVFESPINDGEWHYLTVIYDGAAVSAYENGVLRATGDVGTGPVENERNLCFGNNATYNEVDFKGLMDEIRLYPGVLPAARIRADYLTVTQDLLKAQSGYMTVILLR